MMKKNKLWLVIVIIVVVVGVGIYLLVASKNTKQNPVKPEPVEIPNVAASGDFTYDLIKVVASVNKSNYLISPYSIEVALNLLKEGASGNTLTEISNVIAGRDLTIANEYVKIANALFIKNKYAQVVEQTFTDTLKNKYNADILYDEYKTPMVINNWVNDKTDGMIEKILNDIDEEFVLGLANAIAIDANWASPFECFNTSSEEFVKTDGSTIKVEMMHNHYNWNVKYLDSETKGIILPYQEDLEFIGILPTNIAEFINGLSTESLNSLLNEFKEASSKEHVILHLPRFSYDYSLDNFMDVLKYLGIKDAFASDKADFSKIITQESLAKMDIDNIYVETAIHKTYIDLNEKGTKAAAVTYFGMNVTSALEPVQYEEIEIKFNKPFVYLIRDTKTKEMLFFGVTYEPNIWRTSTCDNY